MYNKFILAYDARKKCGKTVYVFHMFQSFVLRCKMRYTSTHFYKNQ